MKSITYFIVTACAVISGVSASPRGKHGKAAGAGAGAVAGGSVGAAIGAAAGSASTVSSATPTATNAAAVSVAVSRGAKTIVLFEVGGVPGNECLTFRNNGEMVDAACVNTAADRQITPSTAGDQSVLLVQRSFTSGFRPDLVGVEACVGFNGSHFKAEACGAAGITAVSLVGGELQAGTACASGHDGAAQVTVDTTGKTCAQFTTTNVAATAP